MGLIDVEKLRFDEKKSGVAVDLSASSRVEVGGVSVLQKSPEVTVDKGDSDSESKNSKTTTPGKKVNGSDPNHSHALAASHKSSTLLTQRA